jgi:outer membrane autotransporter protein
MNRYLLSAAAVAIVASLSFGASAQTFNNGSFESGDFTGWTQGGGSWFGGPYPAPSNYLPGGVSYNAGSIFNSITTAGFDPLTDGNLRTVYAGNHSARVNDPNNDYSVSVISQRVNGYTDNIIAFAYAAVLEQSHGPTDSGAFIITLTDLTTSETLFNFNLNSATAPGVFTQSSFGWFYSDWIEQSIDVSSRIGHDFLLSLLANDCPYGGHAGYAYLDGFGSVIGGGGTGGGGGGPAGLYWDGGAPANVGNNVVDGGDGVWAFVDPTFTGASGATNSVYSAPATVIFSGSPGTVTVDDSGGQVQATGMDFRVDGYLVTGDSIELVDGSLPPPSASASAAAAFSAPTTGVSEIIVGDGTPAGADITATIDSDLFGEVDLVKLGLGTLALNGDNSFLNLYIGEGTAAIGTSSSAGDGTITIADNATLAAGGPGVVLDNPVVTEGNGLVDAGPAGNVFTLNGDVSGPGSISQVGLGNLVLNGDNGYTNLGINAGTVTFGSNTAGGIGAIAINNNATLAAGVSGLVVANDIQTTGAGTINSGSGVFTLTGVIGNVGSITKTGTGKLILTGANSYSGPTTVAAGNLAVQGNNGTSVVTVKSGATLSGTGTVGTTNVERGGIVSPGNSIGTLVVNGNLNQAAGSIYAVELGTPPNGDRIVVGGSANISAGAIVNVTNTTGSRFVLGSEWAIVQTGVARNGVYTLTGDTRVSEFIDVIGRYDAKNAYLRVAQTSSFASAGSTINQINSATGSDATGNGSLYSAIAYLPNEAAAQDAFDQTSGELHASIRGESFEDSRFVREAIYNHTAQAVEPRIGMWVAGFGSWGSIDSDGNAAQVDRSIGGFFLGVDALKSESASLGVMTGYSTADINVPDRNSYASTDDLYVGLYGSYDVAGFSLTAAVTNTWRWVGTRRSIAFAGFQDSVRANYTINVFQAFGEGSYDFRFGGLGVEPFASFAYVSVKADNFAEFGGPASLVADDNVSDDFWTTLLGIRLNYGLPINGDTFSLSASGGWRYVFEGDVFTPSTMRFYSGPAFEVYGAPVAQNAFAASFTIQTKLTDRADMDIGYSGQYGDGFNDSGVRASLRLRF